MTLILNLPDELANRLAVFLPDGERDGFVVAAIAEALAARHKPTESQLMEALLADLDPEAEPEREAAECRSTVEEGLDDVDAGRDLVTLEEARRRWEAKKRL